jgi:hypothetical protein
VYTNNQEYACNLSPRHIPRARAQPDTFLYYTPDESTEGEDLYTKDADFHIAKDTKELERPNELAAVAEQKALQALKEFVFDEPRSPVVPSPATMVYVTVLPGRRGENDSDVSSCTVGGRVDMSLESDREDVAGARKQQRKLSKEQHKRSETVGDVSRKLKRMLRKLHIGKKADK